MERGRSIVSVLTFVSLHKQIIVNLVYFIVFWLNGMPAHGGISDRLAPREIVTQCLVDYNKHCQVEFWDYVEAHDNSVVTNDMDNRTMSSIALGPSGNMQGTQKALCLMIDVVLKRWKITEFPMPDKAVTKMN